MKECGVYKQCAMKVFTEQVILKPCMKYESIDVECFHVLIHTTFFLHIWAFKNYLNAFTSAV